MNRFGRARRVVVMAAVMARMAEAATGSSESANNRYPEPIFRAAVKEDTFLLPMDPGQTAIAAPQAASDAARALQRDLQTRYGQRLAILPADQWRPETAGTRHWILIGTIEDNPWLLDLYGQRRFLCDALFPGKGGFAVQSVRSPWGPERFCITISGHDAGALRAAVRCVADQLPAEPALGPIRRVQGEGVEGVLLSPQSARAALEGFQATRLDLRPPYAWFANWGVLYYLTGDRAYADCLREAYAHVIERAKRSGKWVSEPWTNVHFLLSQIVMAWDLVECDPYFTSEDRRRIAQVLWAWTHFVDGMSYLRPEWCAPGEIRQNHSTYAALSLHYAHRHFSTRYDSLPGLDQLAEKADRCFAGQSTSCRPNDDAGHYLLLSPLDTIAYRIRRRDMTWIDQGRLTALADLVAATTNNLRSSVPWGDVGAYHRFHPTDPHDNTTRALSMAAHYHRDGAARWAFDWLGARSRPTLHTVIEGMYATHVQAVSPERYLGVRPLILDDSAVRWAAKRNAADTTGPDRSHRYLDKLSMRRDFDPQSEYLLLEGTSTFSHGHLDGNTIASLTWRDRIWLFDMDYIRAAPREHNGVEITRDGLQRPVPSLTRLHWAADFAHAGLVRTSVADYNGADWERTILWHKSNHFIVRDVVTPGAAGDYRATVRFRTKGEVALHDNQLMINQDGERFHIDSGDASSKSITRQRDGSHADWSQYPHDDSTTVVYRGEYTGHRSSGAGLIFLHALYPGERPAGSLRTGAGGFYWESHAGRQAGSDQPSLLAAASLRSDAAYWWATEDALYLADATRLGHADRSIALSAPAAWACNRKDGQVCVVVERPTAYRCERCRISKADGSLAPPGVLSPGAYWAEMGWLSEYDMLFARVAQSASEARPPARPRPVAFGWTIEDRGRLPDEAAARPTAWGNGSRPGELLIGTANGEVWTAGAEKRPVRIAALRTGAPVRFVGGATLRAGSSGAESVVIAGDERAKVSCLSPQGSVKWSADLEGDHSRPAVVTSLAVAPIGAGGEPALLLGTESWNVFALTPGGEKLWRGFVHYHAVTAVQPFELRPGQWRIAVGTEYHTPLNVLNERGELEWFAWEQMGSESRAATDYFGYGLTQLLAHDLDGDGAAELIFGGDGNVLAAVRAADGQTVWSTPVADKVLGLALVNIPPHGRALLAILADGTLLHLGLDGAVRSYVRLDSRITHAARIPNTAWHVLALEDGGVSLIDGAAKVRAIHDLEDESVMWLSPLADPDGIGVTVAAQRRVLRLLHQPRPGRASRFF